VLVVQPLEARLLFEKDYLLVLLLPLFIFFKCM
jgi:hypothetical protein